MTEIHAFLKKADRFFLDADLLLQTGSTDSAASRAYYACFYVAQALLLTQGYKFSSHGQVVAQYGLLFSRTEVFDRRFHQLLLRAFKVRQIADYQSEVDIQPGVVEELIGVGREFLAAASRYLEDLPGSAEGSESGED